MMLDTRILWLWLHLLGVMVWAGGFFYLLMALVPAMGTGKATEDRIAVLQKAVSLFRRISWVAIVLIVVTGFLNLMKRAGLARAAREASTQPENYPLFPEGYMMILTVKLVIVLGLIIHQAAKLLEPRMLEDGRIGFKSGAVGIVTSLLFIITMLLGIVLLTL
jgi:uncharacterized membrane protein